MAYLNILAAVSPSQVDALREDASVLLRPSIRDAVSHLMAYWIRVQPLGQLLSHAIDGGAPLRDDLWHPLREPVYHMPAVAQLWYEQLVITWAMTTEWDQLPERGWLEDAMRRLLRVYGRAAKAGECVVSVLGPPADNDRARRVKYPLAPE